MGTIEHLLFWEGDKTNTKPGSGGRHSRARGWDESKVWWTSESIWALLGANRKQGAEKGRHLMGVFKGSSQLPRREGQKQGDPAGRFTEIQVRDSFVGTRVGIGGVAGRVGIQTEGEGRSSRV